MMMKPLVTLPALSRLAGLAAGGAIALFGAATAANAQSVSAPLTITTLAGTAGVRQDKDGTGAAASFYGPAGMTFDQSGNIVLADACNNLIRKVTVGGTVTTFAGTPINPPTVSSNVGHADGTGAAASFFIGSFQSTTGAPFDQPNFARPGSITVGEDGSGNFFVADTNNYIIRKITPAGVVTTIAGQAGANGTADGAASDARFLVPAGCAVDSHGNVFVTDSGNDTIRKITPTGIVSTFAGTARAFGSADGTGAAARFTDPEGIVVDSSDNLYVTDSGSNTIRKITPSAVVTTVAGSAGQVGTADGNGAQARFNGPLGIAIDSTGNLYVADTKNHTIRKITVGGTVTTIAGSKGVVGSTDGTGTNALFDHPTGILVDSTGANVYIADFGSSATVSYGNTIRHGVVSSSAGSLTVAEVPPAIVQVTSTSNVTLKVVASGSPSPTYQWSKNGTAIAGATNATLTLNSVTSADTANYSVLVTSNLVTITSAPTSLTVFAQGTAVPVTIVAQPADRSVAAGQSTTFTVEASSPSANTLSYQWKKDGTAIAGANASSYTIASVQTSDDGVYTVTVSDGVNASTTSSGATLTVTGGATPVAPSFSSQPVSQSVLAGATVTFTASASGTPSPTYQWQKDGTNLTNGGSVSGAATASLTITGVTTTDAGNYTLVATNSAGTATSNAATLTVSSTTTDPGRLINVSINTNINANENFTMSFVVGPATLSGTKPLLARADGPSLTTYNVTNYLPDPAFDFYNDQTKVASNDNWGGDAQVTTVAHAVGAFPYTDPNSTDAALYLPAVASGSHSIIISGHSGSGVVLGEIYDATPSSQFTASTPRLINISVNKNIGTFSTVGFVIGGSTNLKVLIRAVGPGLAQFGLTDYIADPTMTLYDANSNPLDTNNDWDATATPLADQKTTGAFDIAVGSKDAVLIKTLPPGAYTVQVKAATGNTGRGLLEVYEMH